LLVLPSNAVLSKLIAALYDAVSDQSLWPVFLHDLALATHSSQSAILFHDLNHGEHAVSLAWGVEDAAMRDYQQHFGTCDLWLQKGAPLAYTGWLATGEEVCPFEEFSRSEFYSDYLRPNGIAHAMWGVIEKSPSTLINVGVYRELRRGSFQSKNLELLQFLAPHLQRGFRLHLQLSELRAQAANLERAVDMLPTGIIFLASDGRIIHLNKAAAKILNENDGIVARQGRLFAERSAESSRLESLISQASATSMGTGLGPAGGMTISRRLRPPLQVLITPVRKMDLDANCRVSAMVFVADPAQRVRPAPDILRALFGLTPAECRVALLLGDGHAPPEIAGMVGVTVNTLKTQLASIYRKTGTSRQAQLVRILSQLTIGS
jgi:DNA-binding CsgD family transcriptional regulator/PAS domain-containing protein